MDLMLKAEEINKTFILHLQRGKKIKVLQNLNLQVKKGECLILDGPSGVGKSTILKILYGNYKPDHGEIWVYHQNKWLDLIQIRPWELLEVRKYTIGYVSQSLHIIPRIPAIEIVQEPLCQLGFSKEVSSQRAESLLLRLNIPRLLWTVSPTTFSGGEKQRINLARCFIFEFPILLLDEPTAGLDEINRGVVVELIREAKARGAAIIGVFHDREVQEAIGDRRLEIVSEN